MAEGTGTPRILMLSSPGSGPMPKIVPELESALRRRDTAVDWLPWGSRGSRETTGVRLLSRLGDAISARRFLLSHPGTVLLVHTAHDGRAVPRDLLLLGLCRNHAACSVLVLHGSSPGRVASSPTSLFSRLTRTVFKMSDVVAVMSSEEALEWRRLAPGSHVEVVRNCLPPPPVGRSGQSSRPSRPRILFVGRLIPTKGCYDLLAAFRLVKRRFDCELRIVGDGPQRAGLAQAVDEAGLAADVSIMGTLIGSALEDEYAAATVLALPTSWEGLPTVVLEAMARGLPVVTTRIRGSADYFTDLEDVLFVHPGAPEELAAALERLLGDAGLRRRLAEAAKVTVRQFGSDSVACDYERVIRDALRVAEERGIQR